MMCFDIKISKYCIGSAQIFLFLIYNTELIKVKKQHIEIGQNHQQELLLNLITGRFK